MKLKLVEGYKSVPDVSLAMMRKEVHGVCQSLNALQGGNLQGWIAAGKLKVLFSLEPKPLASLKGVRTIFEYAKTDEQRAILQAQRLDLDHGPADADAAQRARRSRRGAAQGVHRGGESPELKAEVEKVGGEVTLVTGEAMQKTVEEIMTTPPAIAEKMQQMIQSR